MKNMLKLRKDEMLVTFFFYFLIGTIMGVVMDVIASFDVEEGNTVPNFVGIMLLMMLATIGVIFHLIYLKTHFNLVIGMGQTRKEFIKQYMVSSIGFLLVNLVIVYIVAFVEHLILSNIDLGEAVYEEIIFSFLFSPWIILCVFLTLAMEMFLSAALMRWGAKCFWIIYGIGMGCLFCGRLGGHGEPPRFLIAIVDFFSNIGVAGIVGLLVVLGVVLLVSAVKLLMKQQVTV